MLSLIYIYIYLYITIYIASLAPYVSNLPVPTQSSAVHKKPNKLLHLA